jgi:starch synthase (maltosyl-transferring)
VNERVQANSGLATAAAFLIEDIYPSVDGGRFAVKRIVGETVEVWADIFRNGHDITAAALLWKRAGASEWQRAPMQHHSNDRWAGSFRPTECGRYVYAVEAWTDDFSTWRRDFQRKQDAGLDVSLDALEGASLLTQAEVTDPAAAAVIIEKCEDFLKNGVAAPLLSPLLADAMASSQVKTGRTVSRSYPLVIDRPTARYGSWYEMIPRSQGTEPGRHGTFRDCIARLPDIAAMGFDVVYLTPIHPIGHTNRKGRNNALIAGPDDPGSFYAIGGPDGGHDAVHPELGTLDDFRSFVTACKQHNMEVALDFAVQCSPDHPWLREHPEWFRKRPDGSMRYAENPPKKYEDIVNPDFDSSSAFSIWTALRDVILFWVNTGVRIFRIDNPHTKPFPFWEWLISEVQNRHPDVIFLAEAFTRPKLMKGLAKLGFTQSYTYFTWRTYKGEIEEYLRELTRYPERDYYRPNFFVNTPDILPFHLQGGEPWMFKSRVALAATLSSTYGIYNGFELLEHDALPGREEYVNSDKYEIKVRDWNKPGNIKDYIRQLNQIRRDNAALQQTANLQFVAIEGDRATGFIKQSVDGRNIVAVAIALSPDTQEIWFPFGETELVTDSGRRRIVAVEDLRTGERHAIEWGGIRLRIDPHREPAILLRCLA